MNTSAKLIFLCGKMAAGKSTLARDLAERHNALLLVQDEFLETLFPGEITDIPGFFDRSSRLRDALTPHIGAVLSVGVSVTSGRNRYLGPTTGIRVRGGYGFLTDATRNTVTLNSIDDRFEGLQAGVLVWGGAPALIAPTTTGLLSGSSEVISKELQPPTSVPLPGRVAPERTTVSESSSMARPIRTACRSSHSTG